MKRYVLFGMIYMLVMLTGCGEDTPGLTPTPTNAPTPTTALQETLTPEPTNTVAPTDVPDFTATPVPSETPLPTVAPEPTNAPTATPTLAPTMAPKETLTPTPSYTYTDIEDKELWTTANLNMRTLPGTSGEIMLTAPKGSKVLAIRQCEETGWYEVEYNGKTGYMSNAYLTDEAPATPTPTSSPTPVPTKVPAEGRDTYLIVIDPGHQRKGNYEKEPNGPGSEELKAKVSSGTAGVVTGIAEYVLNLEVSFYIREELEARGYEVVMIRETHDIDISNVERALTANELNADAFIRVHANSSSNASVEGVETICQTKKNPYNAYLYEESKRLSELVLEEVVEETGAKKRHVWETDTMTGINWTTVPTTILEMGYMSNEKEDKLMATEEYRRQIAKGVADAIDRYLGREN